MNLNLLIQFTILFSDLDSADCSPKPDNNKLCVESVCVYRANSFWVHAGLHHCDFVHFVEVVDKDSEAEGN